MNEAIWNDVNEMIWYGLTSTSEKNNSINYWFMIIICTFARPTRMGKIAMQQEQDGNATTLKFRLTTHLSHASKEKLWIMN